MDEQNVRRPRRLRRALLRLLGLALLVLVFVAASQPQGFEGAWSSLLANFSADDALVEDDALRASGIIQVEEVAVASEFGGRIAALPVAEGDSIAAGDVLVQLDAALLDAQIEAARAALALAEAALAQARAGARAGQVQAAQAQLAQAQAAQAAATQAVSDTLALVENPQDVRLQIAVTQAQAEAAEYQTLQAQALKDAAETAKNEFENAQGMEGSHKILLPSGPVWVNVSLPLELHLTPNQWWQAWVGLNAATARQEGLQSTLYHLYAQREHPQGLETQADGALAALAQAKAQVAAAQAQVDGLQAGASAEQVAALQARVAQAQAVLDSLQTQRGLLEITSPLDGVALDLAMYQGEVAAPGAALLTVSDLSVVNLVVYLPETKIGQVHLGQEVQVTVDSFPNQTFEGQVAHIADRAEFTPRNVATQEERVNLVFAVEIRLPNDEGLLKPGMPADARFEGREASSDDSPRSRAEGERRGAGTWC